MPYILPFKAKVYILLPNGFQTTISNLQLNLYRTRLQRIMWKSFASVGWEKQAILNRSRLPKRSIWDRLSRSLYNKKRGKTKAVDNSTNPSTNYKQYVTRINSFILCRCGAGTHNLLFIQPVWEYSSFECILLNFQLLM